MDDVKVFDSDDEKLKILGELLSNETSRKIIKLLIDNEMYTNEIATKLNMRVSLVIHHLKKLEQIGLIEVNEKKIIKRGVDHRYFRAIPTLFIAPSQTKEELESKSTFKRIFKEGIKFASVGIGATGTWLITNIEKNIPQSSLKLDRLIYNPDDIIPEVVIESSFNYESFLPVIVLSVGLFLIWFSKK